MLILPGMEDLECLKERNDAMRFTDLPESRNVKAELCGHVETLTVPWLNWSLRLLSFFVSLTLGNQIG